MAEKAMKDLEKNRQVIRTLFQREDSSLCVKSLNWVMKKFSLVVFLFFILYVGLSVLWVNHIWTSEGHSWDVLYFEGLQSQEIVDFFIYFVVSVLFVGLMTFGSAFLVMVLTGDNGYLKHHIRKTFLKSAGLGNKTGQELMEEGSLEEIYKLMKLLDCNPYVEEMSGRIVTKDGLR